MATPSNRLTGIPGGARPALEAEDRARLAPVLDALAARPSHRRSEEALRVLYAIDRGRVRRLPLMELAGMQRLRDRALREAARGGLVPRGVASVLRWASDLDAATLTALARGVPRVMESPGEAGAGEWDEWEVRSVLLDVVGRPAADGEVLAAVLERTTIRDDDQGPAYQSVNAVEGALVQRLLEGGNPAMGERIWSALEREPGLPRDALTLALARLDGALWRRIVTGRFVGHGAPKIDHFTWAEQLQGLLAMATDEQLAGLDAEEVVVALDALGTRRLAVLAEERAGPLRDLVSRAFERAVERSVPEHDGRLTALLGVVGGWPAAAGPLPLSPALLARLLAMADREARTELIRRTTARGAARPTVPGGRGR